MEKDIRNLEPTRLWNYFADLNAVPRASKKEQQVIQFIMDFGNRLQLPVHQDETGNVIIRKPATAGMEQKKAVVLQSHLDMVHQKNNDTDFNFDTEGIRMFIDGDWVKANGTTLGADNGIGVAAIMSLLAANDIPHPAIEALFTIDEETGMTGALGLQGGLLHAGILLNLDTEDDRELTIGCAGGIDITASGKYEEESSKPGVSAYLISVKGLTGGHSGMDIHKGRGNSNKLMNRVLATLAENTGARIHAIDGGGLRNAIPRESVSIVSVEHSRIDMLFKTITELDTIFREEYWVTDPQVKLAAEPVATPETVFPISFQQRLLKAVYACPNGIYRMSPDIAGLVQTSNNIARILVQQGAYSILCLTRSSVNSEKMDLASSIRSSFELMDATVTYGGAYPGWAPKPDASIVKLMRGIYKELYQEEPLVNACHAGLECGIIGRNYPGMEMISFGPNIHGAHSPDEKVQISSVQKFWTFLLTTLQRI